MSFLAFSFPLPTLAPPVLAVVNGRCCLLICGSPHAGHNRVVTYAPVSLAVMRAFEGK